MTEEKALALLKDRDPEGLDWLIRRYTPYVSTVIWNIIGRQMPVQDAEELCSDVFLALWQNGDRPRPGKVKSYLGSIARHKAINRLRERGVELGSEEDAVAIAISGPDRVAEQRELARLLKEAVESLDWPDREIFLRFYYYCQTTADIAVEMELGHASVRKRLDRGREKLKRYLEERRFCDAVSDII